MRIGIDVGGTKTDAVVLDAAGLPIERVRQATGFGGPAVLTTVWNAVERLADAVRVRPSAFESIGIGIPGVVEQHTGVVRHAVNLGVSELPLGDTLDDRYGVPVRIENDVKAAALGAFHLMSLRGSMAFLNLGTGLAAGFVVDGRPWRGARGAAGEIGHIPVDPAGAVCACGQRGCLETIASGSGVARAWPTGAELPARDLFERADAGDETAKAVRATFAFGVASAVRVLVLTADVEVVVIGGGLANLGDALLLDVRDELARMAMNAPFISSLQLPGRVRVAPRDVPIAAVGAALVGAEGADREPTSRQPVH